MYHWSAGNMKMNEGITEKEEELKKQDELKRTGMGSLDRYKEFAKLKAQKKKEEKKMQLNQEAIQICPACETRSLVVWYSSGYEHTKLFCLDCGRFWLEAEAEMIQDPREYTDWKIRELDKKVQKSIESIAVEEEEDVYGKYIDKKNEQLDKDVEGIVEGAISKVITASHAACHAAGIPCDPNTYDGIRSIEFCLEKMKKEMKQNE